MPDGLTRTSSNGMIVLIMFYARIMGLRSCFTPIKHLG